MSDLKDSYEIWSNGIVVSNSANTYEYKICLQGSKSTKHCIVRVIENKITELYFFSYNLSDLYLISITNDKYDTYKYLNNTIIRCDGEVYKFVDEGILRVSDSRLYKKIEYTINDIPDIVCIAAYILNNDNYLGSYINDDKYKLSNFDIGKLKKLLYKINNFYSNNKDFAINVKSRLKLC